MENSEFLWRQGRMGEGTNILLVGNGFDLAHGLPTDYQSFANFLSAAQAGCYGAGSRAETLKNLEKYDVGPELGQFLLDTFASAPGRRDARMRELQGLMHDNFWVGYFRPRSREENVWVSFENKISELVQMLDAYRKTTDKAEQLRLWRQLSGRLGQAGADLRGARFPAGGMERLVERLLSSLSRLIRCLEIYLCLCLDRIPVRRRLGAVLDIGNIDRVLSFNYTDTFERLYQPGLARPPRYCYIHGRAAADNTLDGNNMVLGIDEYLEGDARSQEITFIQFKKFYQRIYKQTDYQYTKWFAEPGPKNLYILGHSLDVTDQDVLQYIITREDVTTTIFYHCRENNARQIQNLLQVLGYDELNALTRGRKNSSVTFRQLY